jgi:AcrR family transcriptional regulator
MAVNGYDRCHMTAEELPVAATHAVPESRAARAARRRNSRGEGDRLRVELLEAAVELMAESGDVDKVSLRAIAQRAGVSPTAVYLHFEDHRTLLRAAVAYCWDEFEARLDAVDDETDDPFRRLRAAGDAYVAFAVEQHGKYAVLFSNRIDVRDRPDESFGESAFAQLVDHVTAILDANGDDRDPLFVAVQLHSWIHGIVDLTCRHPMFEWPSTDALLDDLVVRLGLVPTTG